MIYFLRDPDTGRVKIGTSSHLARRLKELSAEFGGGLEVLAVADGSFDVECRLHQKFAHLRLAGEWFAPGADLLDFIATEGKPWDDSCGEKEEWFKIVRGGKGSDDRRHVFVCFPDASQEDLEWLIEDRGRKEEYFGGEKRRYEEVYADRYGERALKKLQRRLQFGGGEDQGVN